MPMNIYIFDTTTFPVHLTLAVTMDEKGGISGQLDVLQYVADEYVPSTLGLSSIDVAWHLRPGKPSPSSAMSPIEVQFSRNESYAALDSLFSILNCKWVNKREIINHLESNKLLQQFIAARCGLSIPATIVTNDPRQLNDFTNKKSKLLLKTLGYTHLDKDDTNHFIYSQVFTAEELKAENCSIQNCPVFAQHYIEKKYEYRVMAIGSKVLSCQIDSQASEKTKIDWRHYDFDNVTHIEKELPYDIEKKILCFMKAIDLSYGAIDLIETPEGEFVFLEINPSGQWEWIHKLTNLPIPQAVATMLHEM